MNLNILPLRLSVINLTLLFLLTISSSDIFVETRDYYYSRTRSDPNHLRVSEQFKNPYAQEVKYVSRINGTRYEYYISPKNHRNEHSTTHGMTGSSHPSSRTTNEFGDSSHQHYRSHDEMVFETIDKMFQHRLSPFYVHHYDSEKDKRRSSDSKLVSREACARDLSYLVDKLPLTNMNYNPFHMSYETSLNNMKHQHVTSQSSPSNEIDPNQQHLTPELMALFDSYGKQEAGVFMGNIFWVGGYDQCINRHIFDLTQENAFSNSKYPHTSTSSSDGRQVVSFKGRYCVAALKSPVWDSIIKQRQARGSSYFKTERQMNDYQKLFRLQLGVCLPDSCDSSSLELHHDELKMLATSMLDSRYAHYDMVDLYCLPDEQSPLRKLSGSARNFVIFLTFWVSLLVVATLADVLGFGHMPTIDNKLEESTKTQEKPRQRVRFTKTQKFVNWFSLRQNYLKLMSVKETSKSQGDHSGTQKKHHMASAAGEPTHQDEKQTSGIVEPNPSNTNTPDSSRESQSQIVYNPIEVNLRFLNAFKALIMFWIINGHIMLLMIQTAKNILYSDALLNGLMHFLIGATFGVDLFFTMTGFLTSYLLFDSGHARKMRIGTWLYLSFHRYWRLAPMYLMTFWFSRSVMQLLGSGPLWDYGTSSITFRGLCNNESWWYPLTLTSNLHGLFEECMITSWYISCDMQFWLVSPIFIHLLAKSPAAGWAASIATIVMSSKVRYDNILSEETARYDELVQPRADIFMRVSHDLPALYTQPHYRISAYIVGLLAGHYVYMVKSGRWSSGLIQQEPVINNSQQPAVIEKSAQKKTEASFKKMRNFLAYLGLTLFLVMAFVSYLMSHYFPLFLLKYSKEIASYAYSVDHLIMSIGASLCIVVMCFGQWSRLVKFLSHPHWTRISKINYALLLLQCEAIYYQIFRYDQVPVAGTKELINILFNLLVTLYPVAFLVTLGVEFPLANMEKMLV